MQTRDECLPRNWACGQTAPKKAEAMIKGLTEYGTVRTEYQNSRSFCEQQLVVLFISVTSER